MDARQEIKDRVAQAVMKVLAQPVQVAWSKCRDAQRRELDRLQVSWSECQDEQQRELDRLARECAAEITSMGEKWETPYRAAYPQSVVDFERLMHMPEDSYTAGLKERPADVLRLIEGHLLQQCDAATAEVQPATAAARPRKRHSKGGRPKKYDDSAIERDIENGMDNAQLKDKHNFPSVDAVRTKRRRLKRDKTRRTSG